MLKALLAAARVVAAAHDRWRVRAAPRRPMLVEVSILRERVERLRAENGLLRSRLLRMRPRRQPRYRRFERLRILWHAARYGLSVKATARAFVLSPSTISGWRKALEVKGQDLVQAHRPVNRLPDLVADVARRVKREWPRWGSRRIAGVLARVGLKVSRTSVQAFLRRVPKSPPPPVVTTVHAGHVRAKHPGHIYMIDFTRVGGLLRSVFVSAVIDAYSRKVLAIGVAPHEPTAAFAVRLRREAVTNHGAPTWIVSDHGKQLTAKSFIRALRSRAIRRRFGAVHRSGSIALIERFWKSVKTEHSTWLWLYRPLATIERHLESYTRWFNEHRPHQGLGQQTPDEVHFGRSTRATSVPLAAVLAVTDLDGDHDLPVLRLARAA